MTVGIVLVAIGAFTKLGTVPVPLLAAGRDGPAAQHRSAPTSTRRRWWKPVCTWWPASRRRSPRAAPWRPLVITVGLFTMVAGGLRALRQYDLKLLLAHGTVSQLGFLMVMFGAWDSTRDDDGRHHHADVSRRVQGGAVHGGRHPRPPDRHRRHPPAAPGGRRVEPDTDRRRHQRGASMAGIPMWSLSPRKPTSRRCETVGSWATTSCSQSWSSARRSRSPTAPGSCGVRSCCPAACSPAKSPEGVAVPHPDRLRSMFTTSEPPTRRSLGAGCCPRHAHGDRRSRPVRARPDRHRRCALAGRRTANTHLAIWHGVNLVLGLPPPDVRVGSRRVPRPPPACPRPRQGRGDPHRHRRLPRRAAGSEPRRLRDPRSSRTAHCRSTPA